jgi:hypothetical protein
LVEKAISRVKSEEEVRKELSNMKQNFAKNEENKSLNDLISCRISFKPLKMAARRNAQGKVKDVQQIASAQEDLTRLEQAS